MFKKIKLFALWFSYKLAELRNVYSHKAVAQRQCKKTNETLIMYTILGKRDIYQISITKLMNDKVLLERFHPCQAAKFGAIALGDILFSKPEEERQQQYEKIKYQMLTPDDKTYQENNFSDQDDLK